MESDEKYLYVWNGHVGKQFIMYQIYQIQYNI